MRKPKIITSVVLEKITPKHYRFLYRLLKERPKEANISHSKMPTYKAHCDYWRCNITMKGAYIISFNKKSAGYVYLMAGNHIGIQIAKEYQGLDIPTKALKLLMLMHPEDTYYANVAPWNLKSQAFFSKRGFSICQYTYKYSPNW